MKKIRTLPFVRNHCENENDDDIMKKCNGLDTDHDSDNENDDDSVSVLFIFQNVYQLL